MGMFDSFYMKAKCPFCGEKKVFEFQTKALMNNMISWKQGQRFDKFKRRIVKWAWHEMPIIKEGILLDCIASCYSEICYDKKEFGGRSFYGDVYIKNGKVHKVVVHKKERK